MGRGPPIEHKMGALEPTVPTNVQITELPQPIVLEAELPDEPAEPTQVFAGVAGVPSKFYILKKDLDRVGYTAAISSV